MSAKNRKVFLIAIFVFALLLRIGFILFYDDHRFLSQAYDASDSVTYDAVARNILDGKGFQLDDYFRARIAPAYPLFLAIVYSIAGHDLVVIRVIQAFIGALSCVIIYFIARDLFDDRVAMISSAIMVFYYHFIQMPAYAVAEELYLSLLVAAIFFTVRLVNSPRMAFAVFAGLFYALALLCKGTLLGFIPLFIAGIFVAFRMDPVKRIKYCAVLLAAIALTLLPWAVRNYKVYRAFIPVSILSGDLLYKGNSPDATGGSGGLHSRGVDFVDAQIPAGLNEYEADRYLQAKAVDFIKRNPARFLELAAAKFWNMWRPYYSSSSIIGKAAMMASYVPIALLALLGMIISVVSWRKYLIFYFLIVYYAAAHMVFIGTIRYRYPVEPFLIIFCSYAVIFLFDMRKCRAAVLPGADV